MAAQKSAFLPSWRIVLPAFLGTLLFYAAMFFVTRRIHHFFTPDQWGEFWLTVLIGFAGAAFGWFAGFLMSPYDDADAARIKIIMSLLSTLVSGYLLGKVDGSIATYAPQILTHPIQATRFLNFCVNFFATGMTVYLLRLFDHKNLLKTNSSCGCHCIDRAHEKSSS